MNSEFNPIQSTQYSICYKIKSRLWRFVNATLFRLTPWFMRRTRVAILKLFGAKLEWNCSVSNKAEIVDPWNLTMGSLSSLDEYCCIRCRGKVTIGEKVCISRGVYLLSASHNIYSRNFEMTTAPIVIEDNCWIATRSMIGKGVTIGEGTVVAAYSNVIKNIEPWSVVGGNPAKSIKKRVIKDE